MSLLDQYIIKRFLVNFAILFALVYLLASSIDLILQLDEFTQVVQDKYGKDIGFISSLYEVSKLAIDLYWPRFFQLYAYLLGIVSVGAMGFTLSQMYRHRELVAILANGMSLYRVAWPIIVAAFGLNLLHIVNSNIILPQLAPLLIRSYGDLNPATSESFPVPFTKDGQGALVQSPAFHRDTEVLEFPTILVRDEQGRTLRRITADSAEWDQSQEAWVLAHGVMVSRGPSADEESGPAADEDQLLFRNEATLFSTDLTPRALIVRHYSAFAQMLGPAQIEELLESPGAVDVASLARIKFSRYSVVLTNVLMVLLTLPFFLLREPANLVRKSILCAGVALSIMLGSFVGMELDLPGMLSSPLVSVFLPVVVLLPLAFFAVAMIRT